MNWNREKLLENTNGLNDTECEIFNFVTYNSIDALRFVLKYEIKVGDELNKMIEEYKKSFERYLEEHPFRRVWDKIIDGAKMEILIHFTDYGDEYKKCAERVNKLWNVPQCKGMVCMILKSFAERDWDELENKFDGIYGAYEEAQIDIEHSCYTIVENLDTEDLKTIIWFCGGK